MAKKIVFVVLTVVLIGCRRRETASDLKVAPRDVILVTAHFGNWELMGPRLCRAGYVLNAISRTGRACDRCSGRAASLAKTNPTSPLEVVF